MIGNLFGYSEESGVTRYPTDLARRIGHILSVYQRF